MCANISATYRTRLVSQERERVLGLRLVYYSMPAPLDPAVVDLVAEFAINGVAHIDAAIPRGQVERMRSVWPAVREEFDRRFGPEHMSVAADGSYSGKGPHRHQITPLPLAPPFIGDAAVPGGPLTCILEHPTCHAFLTHVLGPDYCCSGWGANVPWPGSTWQRWHVDGLGAGPKRWISVHWVIDDTISTSQGPLEYLPSTQHVPALFRGLGGAREQEGTPITAAIDQLVSLPGPGVVTGDAPHLGRKWADGHLGPLRLDGATRRGFVPVPMLMRTGQLWFRDNLVYHRGTPNTSGQPRDLFHLYVHSASEPAVGEMSRGRGSSRARHFIPKPVWLRLTAQARSVFRKLRVAEVAEVRAEREAAGGWPEEDVLHLASL